MCQAEKLRVVSMINAPASEDCCLDTQEGPVPFETVEQAIENVWSQAVGRTFRKLWEICYDTFEEKK